MRPPDHPKRLAFLIGLIASCINAEVCPLETPTESPSTDASTSVLGPAKRLILKPKTCPDFKDDADQSYCCPSRITFGSFYCCTLNQKYEIQSEIAAERRRQFVKKYLAVIIIVTISLSVLSIIIASIICKRVRCCPLHHSKDSYSRSSNSFQIPSSHSVIGSSRYQPVGQIAPLSNGQSRHSGTFNNLNSTPPQANKIVSYDAPPPYESLTDHQSPAQIQHQYNRIMENQLNNMLQSQNDQPTIASTIQRTSGDFVVVPPPAELIHPQSLHNVD